MVFPSLEEFSTVCCDPHKGFSIVNETEVDVFLEFHCFLCDPESVGNLISGSPAFSKPRWAISRFLVHIMLKPSMQDFKHDLTSMGPWRRKWQPTPVFLPGESHGRRSLVGYTVHWVSKSRTRLSDFTFTSTGDECSCLMINTFFRTTLLGNWDED